MLKKLKRKAARRHMKKVLRSHASEILVGVAMGLLTDIATEVARKMLKKRLPKALR